jgi:hypothetical protein
MSREYLPLHAADLRGYSGVDGQLRLQVRKTRKKANEKEKKRTSNF